MAVAAEALLRLRSVFDGSGIDNASKAIVGLQRQANGTGTPLARIGQGLERVNVAARRLATGGLVATGGAITYSIAKAVEFENSLSDLKKALDLKRGSTMLNQLQNDFLQLSRRVPMAARDLSEIGGIASLSGKTDPRQILQFTENAAKVGTAFDMSGRDAAEALISIQAQLGLTDKATLDLMGTVNTLSDKFDGVVDPRDIVAGLKRGLGALGKTAGLSGEQTSGFLTSFLGAGVPLDNAITGAKNFLKVLTGGDSLSKEKMQGLEQLFGLPVDPVKKQLQDQLNQINKEITSGIDGVGQQRSNALEKLIDDAKFNGKKLIEFDGQTLTLSQAGLIKKKLDSETSAYTKGLKERANEIKAQLKNIPSGGEMIAKDLAKRMQVDPTGTIMEVLQRIKQLPKDQQAGVMNQIFGDESILAISAITENLGLVKKGFDISAQATQNATSWLNEYNNKLENTSSQFQLLKNAFNEMAIRVGTATLPVLTKAMQDMTPTIIELIPPVVSLVKTALPLLVGGLKAILPYAQQFAGWVTANSESIKVFFRNLGSLLLNTGRVVIPAFAEAVKLILPPLNALAGWVKENPDLFKNLVLSFLAFKILGKAFGGFVGTFFKILLASFALGAVGFKQSLGKMLFSSFVGIGFGKLLKPLLTTIFGPGLGSLLSDAMGSLIAGAVLTKLGNFLAAIRSWFGMASKVIQPLVSGLGAALGRVGAVIASTLGKGGGLGVDGLLGGIVKWLSNIRGGFANAGSAARMFFDTLRGFTPQMVMKDGQWVKPLAVRLAEGLRGALAGLGNIGAGGMGSLLPRLGQGVMSLLPVLATVGRAVLAFFSGPVGWITLLATAAIAAYAFRDKLAPVFTGIGGLWNTYVVGPIRTGWAALTAWFGTTMTGAGAGLATAWRTISTFFQTYVITPLKGLWQGFVFYVLQTIQAYGIVWWQTLAAGFQVHVLGPVQMGWASLMTNLGTLWNGFTSWLGTSITYLQQIFAGIWNGIATNFSTWVVIPIQQGWAAFSQWFYQSTQGVRQWLMGLWQGVSQNFLNWVVNPIQQGWGRLTQWLGTSVGAVRGWFGNMWNGLSQGFSTQIATPIQNIWRGVLNFVRTSWTNTVNWFAGVFSSVANFFRTNLVTPVQNMWNGLISGIRGLIDQTFGWLRNLANAVITRVNPIRQAAGMQPIQAFAKGGYVNGPTLAWVGEGKDPGEYIIPSGKMYQASMNFLAGKRGASVLQAANNIRGFASGGYVGKRDRNNDKAKIIDKINGWVVEQYLGSVKGMGGLDFKEPMLRVRKNQDLMYGGLQLFVKASEYANKKEWIARQIQAINNTNKSTGFGVGRAANLAQHPGGMAATGMARGVRNKRQQTPIDYRSATNAMATGGALLPGLKRITQFDPRIKAGLGVSTLMVYSSQGKVYRDLLWTDSNGRTLRTTQAQDIAIDYWNTYASDWRDGLRPLGVNEFAKGGFVKRPTLGLIGEGRDSEYIIPSSKMAASSMAYLSGARGMGVIDPPRFANGGVVGSSSNRSANLDSILQRTGDLRGASVVVEAPTINSTIQIKTGDVVEFQGEHYVSMADYQRGLREVQDRTMALLRTAQGRRATGR